MDRCIWKYREGLNGSHYAFTPCKKGFSYLSRISESKSYVGVADYYNGITCPICGKQVQLDYSDLK